MLISIALPVAPALSTLHRESSQLDAIFWGFVASFSLPASAMLGAHYRPSTKIVAGLLSFTAGVLIALLSYDLVGVSFATGGFAPSFLGMSIGLLTYFLANRWLARIGCQFRRSCKHGGKATANTGALALVLGALIDGIPESASIGVGLMESPVVSIAMITGVFIANIPEGLASGTGLNRAGLKHSQILTIWGLVTVACTLSSWLAFIFLRGSSAFVQATLISTAGGGILAMTLQTVVPEAFDGTDDFISILGCIGFCVVFTLSHLQGPH